MRHKRLASCLLVLGLVLGGRTAWTHHSPASQFDLTTSVKVTGTIQTFNVDVGGGGGYANQGPVDGEQKNPWVDAAAWNGLLTTLVRTGRDPQLERGIGEVLSQIDALDVSLPDLATRPTRQIPKLPPRP